MLRLNTSQADFAERFACLLRWQEADIATIEATVAAIIKQVRTDGDQALVQLTQQFDRIRLEPMQLAFSAEEIDSAWEQCSSEDIQALELAAARIRDYHLWQMPVLGLSSFVDPTGALLGQRLTPLHHVGLYVPGGLASYPSSVLMNAIPATVAGVTNLTMMVPTPDGQLNPLILAAARIAGVHRIFRIGGAQAIAALAYGTQTVAPVDKIVGPGNIFVATAKRQVFGHVGIDMIAGPSEIMIVADQDNDPAWLAADLLSQAEHDESAQAILITDHPPMAEAVIRAIQTHLGKLSRRRVCAQSLAHRGAIIIAKDLMEACRLASNAAPEHLELAVANPETFLPHIQNAGAIFLGRYTPEAIGDYVAGPNHVLPTAGTARFSSPLGVHDFIKRTSVIQCPPATLTAIGPAASRLAAAEGLTAHKLSIDLRLDSLL